VEKERYRATVDDAKAHLDAGSDLDSALAAMRANGLSEIHCINAVHELLDVNLGRARALVYLSPTFADDDAAPESVVGALREVNEIAQRNIPHWRSGAQPMNLSEVQPDNLATFVQRSPSRWEWSWTKAQPGVPC
jgi:hypothetical protein